jgi:hypothetical protein
MFFDDPLVAFCQPGPKARARAAENPWPMIVRQVVAEIIDVPAPDGPGPLRYADTDGLHTLLDRAGNRETDMTDWRLRLAANRAVVLNIIAASPRDGKCAAENLQWAVALSAYGCDSFCVDSEI